jgi:hypothetical protein
MRKKDELKFSTFIYKIIAFDGEVLEYNTLTSFSDEVLEHWVPENNTFPYERLQVGDIYTIVSVKMRNTWNILLAFNLTKSEVIANETLQANLEKIGYGVK